MRDGIDLGQEVGGVRVLAEGDKGFAPGFGQMAQGDAEARGVRVARDGGVEKILCMGLFVGPSTIDDAFQDASEFGREGFEGTDDGPETLFIPGGRGRNRRRFGGQGRVLCLLPLVCETFQ